MAYSRRSALLYFMHSNIDSLYTFLTQKFESMICNIDFKYFNDIFVSSLIGIIPKNGIQKKGFVEGHHTR